MDRNQILLPFFLLCFVGNAAFKTDVSMVEDKRIKLESTSLDNIPTNDSLSNRVRLRVGSSTFQVTLQDNTAATAFNASLPLTLSMNELNGNEKFADLSASLPTNAANPGMIQMGDLMLYGGNTLVLFYKTFRTSYRYTKLGRVDNPRGLATALGLARATVTVERE